MSKIAALMQQIDFWGIFTVKLMKLCIKITIIKMRAHCMSWTKLLHPKNKTEKNQHFQTTGTYLFHINAEMELRSAISMFISTAAGNQILNTMIN